MPLPDGMSARDAMAVGTAGYTAMLSVMALERHGITPDRGPVVVTGAAGGVGSVAIAILSKLGYHVIASTGRTAESAYLKELGAAEIIARDELSGPAKPLAKERWAGGVDAVGSHTLANVLSMTSYGGAVAACGLAGGMDLPASVAPFILRGVSLLGIDSVMAPKALRLEAWRRIGTDLDHREARRRCRRPSASTASSMPRRTSSTARSGPRGRRDVKPHRIGSRILTAKLPKPPRYCVSSSDYGRRDLGETAEAFSRGPGSPDSLRFGKTAKIRTIRRKLFPNLCLARISA